MRRISVAAQVARSIEEFRSGGAASVEVAHGVGATHVYVVYFEAGGAIGLHEAGFDQLFIVASGDAWVAGEDGTRIWLEVGQGAYIERGEMHAKGSRTGGMVVMIQVTSLTSVANGSV